MRPSWLIAAGAVGISGMFIARTTHENLADRVSGEQPGTVELSYYQPAPGLGKLISLGCAIGVAGCLWKGLEPQSETIQSSNFQPINQQPATYNLPAQQHSYQLSASQLQPVYDDPEVEIEAEPALPSPANPEQVTRIHATPSSDPVDLIATCDGKKRHMMFACQTQTGKTTTVRAAIERKHILSNGAVDWTIFDPKKSVWMGLEDLKDEDGSPKVVYMDYDNPSDILKMVPKLKWAITKMTKRQELRKAKRKAGEKYNPKPHILLFDEWVSTKKLANWYDEDRTPEEKKNTVAVWTTIKRMFELLVLNGLEDGMIVWVVTQMPNCEQNDIDSGLRDQFGYWCQGRDGDFRSIEAALGNNWIVPAGKTKNKLKTELDHWVNNHTGLPIVYTNIGGHRILEMPSILDDGGKQIFKVQPTQEKNKVVQFPKAVGSNFNPEPDPLEDYWS